MKKLFFICTLSLSIFFTAQTQASVVNAKNGDLYRGEEVVDGKATGGTCYLYTDYVESSKKGLHCTQITARPVYFTDREIHPQDEMVTVARITNYHRPEYPRIKTCAMNVNGTTYGNEIYGQDTTQLYNQILSWEDTVNGYEFDFFISISAETKLPTRTRLHLLKFNTEKDYDCVRLQKL